MTVVRCLLCGQNHAACGPATTVIGVDQNTVEVGGVGELRPYAVVVGGHKTVMNLNEADAERLGGTPVTPDPQPVTDPQPVADPQPAAPAVPGKARTVVPNKARKAPDR